MMKKPAYSKSLAFFIVSILLLWTVCALILFEYETGGCTESYRNDQKITIHNYYLKTQVAKTDTEKEKGLGGKKCLPDDQAMLFEFNKPDYYPFWMKDMKFPIDIIWLDADKKVVKIEQNVSPLTYPKTFVNTKPAKYVLELKAGSTKKLNISNQTPVSF